jgi:hypothetical protein
MTYAETLDLLLREGHITAEIAEKMHASFAPLAIRKSWFMKEISKLLGLDDTSIKVRFLKL